MLVYSVLYRCNADRTSALSVSNRLKILVNRQGNHVNCYRKRLPVVGAFACARSRRKYPDNRSCMHGVGMRAASDVHRYRSATVREGAQGAGVMPGRPAFSTKPARFWLPASRPHPEPRACGIHCADLRFFAMLQNLHQVVLEKFEAFHRHGPLARCISNRHPERDLARQDRQRPSRIQSSHELAGQPGVHLDPVRHHHGRRFATPDRASLFHEPAATRSASRSSALGAHHQNGQVATGSRMARMVSVAGWTVYNNEIVRLF